MNRYLSLITAVAAFGVLGCAEHPQAEFWQRLAALCNHAYRGHLVDGTAPGDTTFANAELVMHVIRCSDSEIVMPFHVGEDRSRTWIVARTDSGLYLTHYHYRQDGTPDSITMYGGPTRDRGSTSRQEFFADPRTASLVPAAASNVWGVAIVPDSTFTYELIRNGTDRRVRIDFDLTQEVPPPPPPWGSS